MEVCRFQPHLISNFPRGNVLSVLFFHDLLGSFMCSQGFFLGFFQGCQAIFQGWKEGLSQGWICSGLISM